MHNRIVGQVLVTELDDGVPTKTKPARSLNAVFYIAPVLPSAEAILKVMAELWQWECN